MSGIKFCSLLLIFIVLSVWLFNLPFLTITLQVLQLIFDYDWDWLNWKQKQKTGWPNKSQIFVPKFECKLISGLPWLLTIINIISIYFLPFSSSPSLMIKFQLKLIYHVNCFICNTIISLLNCIICLFMFSIIQMICPHTELKVESIFKLIHNDWLTWNFN